MAFLGVGSLHENNLHDRNRKLDTNSNADFVLLLQQHPKRPRTLYHDCKPTEQGNVDVTQHDYYNALHDLLIKYLSNEEARGSTPLNSVVYSKYGFYFSPE